MAALSPIRGGLRAGGGKFSPDMKPVTRTSPGREGRLNFIWTPPKRKTVFGVMIDRLRLQFYIRPLMQTEACGP
jgi:hypothetical protein